MYSKNDFLTVLVVEKCLFITVLYQNMTNCEKCQNLQHKQPNYFTVLTKSKIDYDFFKNPYFLLISFPTYKTQQMTPTAHISVAYPMGSNPTTSGATNSGVPNRICNFFIGSNLRAKPKSMILMRFPLFVRQRMFSGCKRVVNYVRAILKLVTSYKNCNDY